MLILLLVMSCGKTTKSKLNHNWKIDKFSIYNNYDDDIYITQGDDQSFVAVAAGIMGKVFINEITFNKNGTFTQRIKYSASDGDDYWVDLTAQGVWTFLSKNKSMNLTKNEKIQFSLTKMQGIISYAGDDSTINYSAVDEDDSEYGVIVPGGDDLMTFSQSFIVKSSTNKQLVLTSSGGNLHTAFYQQGNDELHQTYSDSEKYTIELTLKKK